MENYPLIYSVFLRNFHPHNPVEALCDYVETLKKLHISHIWFLPHYPIGKRYRKGLLGSPYAIQNYKKVDPNIGSLDHFIKMIQYLKDKGFKIIIDIVFHHVSPDNPLARNEKFILQEFNQSELSHSWSDIVKLNLDNQELQDKLIDVLLYWRDIGIDGFRCDVASLIPMKFWEKAENVLIKHGYTLSFFLAETISYDFYQKYYSSFTHYSGEMELAQIFQYLYAYNSYFFWQLLLQKNMTINEFIRILNFKNQLYGRVSKKCFFTENHDMPPIASYLTDRQNLLWNFFFLMQPGAFMIYNGQELGLKDKISLFDSSPIAWDKGESQFLSWYTRMIQFRNNHILKESKSYLTQISPYVVKQEIYTNKDKKLVVYYNFHCEGTVISTKISESAFHNIFDDQMILIHNSKLAIQPYQAIVIEPTK